MSRWLVSGPAQGHHEPPTATAEVKCGGHRSAFSAVLCSEPHEHDLVCAVVGPRPRLVETDHDPGNRAHPVEAEGLDVVVTPDLNRAPLPVAELELGTAIPFAAAAPLPEPNHVGVRRSERHPVPRACALAPGSPGPAAAVVPIVVVRIPAVVRTAVLTRRRAARSNDS